MKKFLIMLPLIVFAAGTGHAQPPIRPSAIQADQTGLRTHTNLWTIERVRILDALGLTSLDTQWVAEVTAGLATKADSNWVVEALGNLPSGGGSVTNTDETVVGNGADIPLGVNPGVVARLTDLARFLPLDGSEPMTGPLIMGGSNPAGIIMQPNHGTASKEIIFQRMLNEDDVGTIRLKYNSVAGPRERLTVISETIFAGEVADTLAYTGELDELRAAALLKNETEERLREVWPLDPAPAGSSTNWQMDVTIYGWGSDSSSTNITDILSLEPGESVYFHDFFSIHNPDNTAYIELLVQNTLGVGNIAISTVYAEGDAQDLRTITWTGSNVFPIANGVNIMPVNNLLPNHVRVQYLGYETPDPLGRPDVLEIVGIARSRFTETDRYLFTNDTVAQIILVDTPTDDAPVRQVVNAQALRNAYNALLAGINNITPSLVGADLNYKKLRPGQFWEIYQTNETIRFDFAGTRAVEITGGGIVEPRIVAFQYSDGTQAVVVAASSLFRPYLEESSDLNTWAESSTNDYESTWPDLFNGTYTLTYSITSALYYRVLAVSTNDIEGGGQIAFHLPIFGNGSNLDGITGGGGAGTITNILSGNTNLMQVTSSGGPEPIINLSPYATNGIAAALEAHAWGDHALVGYLTSEADTLQAVVNRGGAATGTIDFSAADHVYVPSGDMSPNAPITRSDATQLVSIAVVSGAITRVSFISGSVVVTQICNIIEFEPDFFPETTVTTNGEFIIVRPKFRNRFTGANDFHTIPPATNIVLHPSNGYHQAYWATGATTIAIASALTSQVNGISFHLNAGSWPITFSVTNVSGTGTIAIPTNDVKNILFRSRAFRSAWEASSL